MCEGTGYRCTGSGLCGPSGGRNGCIQVGSRCLGCGVANLAPVGGTSDVPAEGYLIYSEAGFVGWMIKAPGGSGLLKFDIVTAIGGVAPDADWFESLPAGGTPQTVTVSVYRAGQLLTLQMERS